jgi:hypothetical protein
MHQIDFNEELKLLGELDARHDEVLAQLEALDKRVEEVLAQYLPANGRETLKPAA